MSRSQAKYFFISRHFVLSALCVVALGCASLGTYNPATGRNEFIFIPTDTEVAMGREVHQKLLQEFKLSTNPGQIARVNRIGKKVAQVSDRQDYEYHFYLVEKDELNAFTTPGGNIYFYSGLLNKLKTDDEIAAVLAHEIGHCAAKHTIKKYQAAASYSIVESLIFSQIGAENQVVRVASLGSDALNTLIFSAYSRQDELQADKLGLKYLYLAGYALDGIIKTLEVLKAESKGPDLPLILRSHPYLEDRIAAVKKEIERIKAEEQMGR